MNVSIICAFFILHYENIILKLKNIFFKSSLRAETEMQEREMTMTKMCMEYIIKKAKKKVGL